MAKTKTDSRPAVFLDRDGTVIHDRGHLRCKDEVVFFPETAAALRRLQMHARLFIVTNQSGVGKGLISADEVDRVNGYVVEQLRQQGVHIEHVYCCPHLKEDQCSCMKPSPLFIEQAAQDYNLNLSSSFAVGDHPHDVRFAENAGATGIYVLSGHGQKHRHELPAGTVLVPGIREAAEWIIGSLKMKQQEQEYPGLLMRAVRMLNKGGVVAFPTETVYGLGADVFNVEAVARIFEIKQRPYFDPLIVHVSSLDEVETITDELPALAQALIAGFWPGPLTLVLPKNKRVPDLVTSGLPSVAVRMPSHPVALELIRQAGFPLAAPSANLFGQTSPTTAKHVRRQLGDSVDLVLDGGDCSVGVESTIVSLTGDVPVLLRAGGTPVEEIERVTGPLFRPVNSLDRPEAPGQLSRHYSTRIPLFFKENFAGQPEAKRPGLLAFCSPPDGKGFTAVEVLSNQSDLREAAANLFAAMHRLDAMDLDLIVAEKVPERGLGLAINDRLRRAAHHPDPETLNPSKTGEGESI